MLRSQISGDLAELYSQMPFEQARDFEAHRKMVYPRFGINAEHFRRKFHSFTKKPEESYSQLGAKLLQCLDKWMEHENVTSLDQMKKMWLVLNNVIPFCLGHCVIWSKTKIQKKKYIKIITGV